MLTAEENERLTHVGPGTPMGELMRRYWHPIAGSSQLDDEPVTAVRLLGEDLVLYRDRGGRVGLHGDYYDYVRERAGKPKRTNRVYDGAHHVKIGFDLFEHGIVKRRVLEGGDEQDWTWQEGTNPLVFPNMTRAGGNGSLQIRVPT